MYDVANKIVGDKRFTIIKLIVFFGTARIIMCQDLPLGSNLCLEKVQE